MFLITEPSPHSPILVVPGINEIHSIVPHRGGQGVSSYLTEKIQTGSTDESCKHRKLAFNSEVTGRPPTFPGIRDFHRSNTACPSLKSWVSASRIGLRHTSWALKVCKTLLRALVLFPQCKEMVWVRDVRRRTQPDG